MTENLPAHLAQRLVDATGQAAVPSALAWIAEEHPLRSGTVLQQLTQAVLAAEHAGHDIRDALARLTHELAASTVDPANMLFRPELLPDASTFRRALDALAASTPSGTLVDVTATVVRAAQHADREVMETLEALAGVTHKELSERVSARLPNDPRGSWTNAAINAAFAVIDEIVRGDGVAPPGGLAPRPSELMPEVAGRHLDEGWVRVETLRTGGVPYELMLAQRVVGGAWLQHRNRTSKAPVAAVALALREHLREAGFDVALDDAYGGDVKQSVLAELVDGDKAVNVVVRDARTYAPVYAITLSLAKDGGSARKSLRAKIAMKTPNVPTAVVVLGAGFAGRNETTSLVRHFGGAVYSEQTLDQLVQAVEHAAGAPNPATD
jgi:hypothetical protein